MFNMLDKVRVVRGRQTIKEGIVVALTTSGARVYDNELDEADFPFTDSVFFAEWFPFQSAEQHLVVVKPHIRKKSKDI
jgi:hypothetical protein